MEFITGLFDASDFTARWRCGNWTPAHGWLHILSDVAVWAAYFAIPLVLAYFAARRRDLPFRRVFLLFVAFILLCATTHLMEAVIFWWPAYRLAGVIKLLTAVVSWVTVLALVRVAPAVLAMRTPEELEREVAARTDAERRLTEANAELERRVTERTADLAEEKERLRTTLASIGDAVISTDRDGHVTYLNGVAETLTGWTTADAAGVPLTQVFRIVNEDTRQPVENPALRALREGVIVGLANHTILISKDGTERPIDDSAAPIRGKAGEVVGGVLVFRDISERKRADALLAGQKRVLELVASDAPLADVLATLCRTIEEQTPDRLCSVLLLGDDGTHLRVGAGPSLPDAYVRHLDGLGIDPPYHGPCGMALHTGQAVVVTDARTDGRWPAAWRELVAGHGLRACRTVPVAAADGTPLATFAVYGREPGDPAPADPAVLQVATHLAAVAIHRKRAEEELRRRAEEVQVLLDTLPVGIFVAHDPEARTITGNKAAKDLLRNPTRNLSLTAQHDELPTSFRVCRNGVELPVDQLPVQRAARGEVVANEELEVVFEDGSVVNELISAAPLYDADGRVRGSVAGVLDISTRKASEGRLRESEAKYRTLFESMDEGYCVIEVLFDPPGGDRAVDYRFLEVNPAFERHTALRDAVGRTMRDFAPDLDRFWFDTYGRVARTGEPSRFVNEAVALSRWYDVYAFRLGGAGSNRLAVLFNDISDRKRAEETLREREAFIQRILDASPGVVYVFDREDKRTAYINDQVRLVLGVTPEEVIASGRPFMAERVHPDDLPALNEHFDRLSSLANGVVLATEYRMRHADGRWLWFLSRDTVFQRTPDGTPRQVLGVATDITARKEAEVRVRESEERFRLVADAAPVLIWLSGTDKLCSWFNQPWLAFTGRSMAQEVGNGWAEGVHPDDLDRCLQTYNAAFDSRVPFSMEYRLRRHDGEYRWLLDTGVPRYGPDGGLDGYIGSCIDIHNRKQTEVTLKASEVRYRRLFESAKDGILTLDAHAPTITDANPFMTEMLGYSRDEFLGKELWQIGLFKDAEASKAAVRELQERGYIRHDDLPLETKAGRRINVEFVSNVYAEGGEAVIQCNVRDITDRKRLEDSLRQHAAALTEADRRKDVFLATLAHELRNPLAPIRNGLQVIRMAGATGTIEQARGMMERQLGQMVRLVDDLLDVSRVTTGKLTLSTGRLELRAVIDAAVETTRPAIEQAGHDLAVVIPDEPIFVDGDLTRLAQVVSNLLTNSAKYTHRGGHIRVSVGREGRQAVVSVADDGIGIPAAMLGRVFEMFIQVDRTLEKTTGGLGIGLSLVKGLVEMHGGTIEARSEGEGRGSEFVFRLPAVTDAASGADESHRKDEGVVPCGRRRILVVDDNADAADSLGQLLELLGNEVRTAYDGEAGVRAAAEFRPDVVLCDIGMPKVNGYDAARRIRAEPWGKGMVLVALTGWGQEDDRKRTAEAGFDHHLVKPVEPAVLMKLLTEV